MLDVLRAVWPYVASGLGLAAALLASGHALLNKRDVRAAIGWIGFIWMVPVFGPLAYVIFGVNRIRRRAVALRRPVREQGREGAAETIEHLDRGQRGLLRFIDSVVPRPLVVGNRVEPLPGGDLAYERMLQAIDDARRTLTLSTYIFDHDAAGVRFVEALQRAVERGVEVRVLIDAVGDRYTYPPMRRLLRRRGVPSAHFLPTYWPWHMAYVNLRNHRKIMVADGRLAYTGGMNIRQGHCLESGPRSAVRDIHFELAGPVVRQLQEVFAEDWQFATGESLSGEAWFPGLAPEGAVAARGIADGPDEDLYTVRWTLLGALACAEHRVRILTPYFIPISGLAAALEVAARRGVEIDLVLPEKSNLKLVHWASRASWWEVLGGGCRLWLSPPPFDHSKLMLVDDYWAFVGSSNWDPRSLRLNFELNVECRGRELVRQLDGLVQERIERARRVHLEEVRSMGLPVRLSDGAVRLLSPYL